ncbi:MAG: response regulator [bacterium]|nr:response regulator [bacterium]MCP4800462.1 response regulator [bacterium]
MLKILIVDDEPSILNILDFSLGAEGYEVIQASDGAKAYEMAVEHLPDMIVMDVMMPIMDGYQACEKLKADSRTAMIPVLMLTAKSAAEDHQQGKDAGADGYLTKPFSPQRLVELTDSFLGATNK